MAEVKRHGLKRKFWYVEKIWNLQLRGRGQLTSSPGTQVGKPAPMRLQIPNLRRFAPPADPIWGITVSSFPEIERSFVTGSFQSHNQPCDPNPR